MRNLFAAIIILASASAVVAQTAPGPAPTLPVLAEPVADFPRIGVECKDCKRDRFWAEADYLMWWMRKDPIGVPIVTTDTTNGASPTAGGLANPTTQVLIGSNAFGYPIFSGGRLRAGYWCTDDIGFETSGFLFGNRSSGSAVGSDSTGNPFLFRPVANVDTGNPNAGLIVATPGAVAGSVTVSSSTQLWGADALGSAKLINTDKFRLTGLAGFRYLDLREGLGILDNQTDLAGVGTFGGTPTTPGDRVTILDSFRTHNQFYGGDLGLRGELLWNRWVLTGSANVALGCTHQTIDIGGVSTLTPASGAAPTSLPGGLLALPSNSGRFLHNAFSVVPEAELKIGYDLTPRIRLSLGYDFIYWSDVVRPGSQINNNISAAQAPVSPSYAPGTTSAPGAPHNSTGFWAHGVNFGVSFRF
jgi:hypothetical protein